MSLVEEFEKLGIRKRKRTNSDISYDDDIANFIVYDKKGRFLFLDIDSYLKDCILKSSKILTE